MLSLLGRVATVVLSLALLPALMAFTDNASTNSPAGRSTVRVVFVGDIACDPSNSQYNGGRGVATACKQRAVGRLIKRLDPKVVVTAGDNQYENGTLLAYRKSYARAFGSFLGRTKPVPGNHEYNTPGAAGYFQYFGSRAGSAGRSWRSFAPLKGWRVYLLNSNCWAVGGCGAGSRQRKWLMSRMKQRPAACTIGVWHHPYLTAGQYRGNPDVRRLSSPLWHAMARAGGDVIVNGHDHNYQRWALRDRMREFVSGTGGRSHYAVNPVRGLRAYDSRHFGVLEMTLRSDRTYSYRFVQVGGTVSDSGRGACRNNS